MFALSRIAATVTAGALLTAPALANENNEPNFDYVGGSYVKVDVLDESIDGFAVDFEKSLTESFFFGAEYTDASDNVDVNVGDVEAAGVDLSADLLHVNAGYKFFNNGRTVVYGSAGYSRAEATSDISFVDGELTDSYLESESGWNAQVGVRSRLTTNFEVDANVRHIDIADDSDQAYSATGRYFLGDNFSVFAKYTHIDSDLSYAGVGASFHF